MSLTNWDNIHGFRGCCVEWIHVLLLRIIINPWNFFINSGGSIPGGGGGGLHQIFGTQVQHTKKKWTQSDLSFCKNEGSKNLNLMEKGVNWIENEEKGGQSDCVEVLNIDPIASKLSQTGVITAEPLNHAPPPRKLLQWQIQLLAKGGRLCSSPLICHCMWQPHQQSAGLSWYC